MDEFFWHECYICGKPHKTDADPVCNDPACQAFRWAEIERAMAVTYAEKILEDAWIDHEADRMGL